MSSRRNSLEHVLSSQSAAAHEQILTLPVPADDTPPSRSSEVSSRSATSQMSDMADLKAASRSELLDLLTTMQGCSRPDTWTILVDLRTMFEPVRLLNFLLVRYTAVQGCTYEAENDTLVVDDPNRVSETENFSNVVDRLVILNGHPEHLTVKAAVLLFVDRWVEWFPLDFLPYSEVGFKLLRRLLKLLRVVLEEDFPTIITGEAFDRAYPHLKMMLAPLVAQADSSDPENARVPSINTAESTDMTVEAAHKAVVNYLHQLHGLRFDCTVDPSYSDAVDCTPLERKLAYVLFTNVKKSLDNMFEWYSDVALSLVIAECSAGDATIAPPSPEQCRLNTIYDQLFFARSGHTVQRLYTFAKMVPIQPPAANSKRTTSTRTKMTLSQKIRGLSRESSMYEEAQARAQSITDIDPWDVAQQLTVRLHYLYSSVPCAQMLYDMHTSPELTRFRAESERLQSVFVNHILNCTESTERAERVVHLMDVVDVLLEIRSFHAVMLIIMALQSTPLHRLKQTWAHVELEHPFRWENMHRSIGLGGQHLVSRANDILTKDPVCKLEIECPRQAIVDMSLTPLQPTLSRNVTEELLSRPMDALDDPSDDEDDIDDGDTFSNSTLQKVARDILSRAGSSRLDVLKPTREAPPLQLSAEVKRAARIEKLKSIVAQANVVAAPVTPPSLRASSSIDSYMDSNPESSGSGPPTPALLRGSSTPVGGTPGGSGSGSGSGGIAMRRSPLFEKLRSGSQSPTPSAASAEVPAADTHRFFPSSGQPIPARRPQSTAKPPRADQTPPSTHRRTHHHIPKVPPPMIPAYSFPIPMMPYIYGYTRMLMQFKELPAYVAPEADDEVLEQQLNVSRLRKISSITAVLKSCQLTPYQFKSKPEIQQLFEKNIKWLDEDSQWTRSVALEPLSTPSANA